MGRMRCCRLLMPAPLHVQMAVWWVLTFLVLSEQHLQDFSSIWLVNTSPSDVTMTCSWSSQVLVRGLCSIHHCCCLVRNDPRYLRALSKQTGKASGMGERKWSHLCPPAVFGTPGVGAQPLWKGASMCCLLHAPSKSLCLFQSPGKLQHSRVSCVKIQVFSATWHIKWVQSPTGSECHICVQGPHLTLSTGSPGPLWCLFSHLSNRALSSRSYRWPSVFSEFTLPIMLKITPRFHAAQVFLLGRSWFPPLATSVPQACPLCGQVRELSV